MQPKVRQLIPVTCSSEYIHTDIHTARGGGAVPHLQHRVVYGIEALTERTRNRKKKKGSSLIGFGLFVSALLSGVGAGRLR